MTVCVAAIYENNSVLGASDRMLTAGGSIEFEPQQPKVWALSRSIVAMVADDILIHAEIYQDVYSVVSERIAREPDNWFKVSEVAELYSQAYAKLWRKCASRDILEPFGLDFDNFIKKQKEMSSEFIKNIEERLNKYNISGASTILTGIDTDGPHIYVINNQQSSCYDKIGFAAIGVGASHAAPHLIFSGHTRFNSGQKTLLAIHQAKKKSEVAPGVGKGTDMFLIGPQLGSFQWIDGGWIKKLDEIYEANYKAVEKVNGKSEKAVEMFLKKLAEKKAQEQKVDSTVELPKPEDGK